MQLPLKQLNKQLQQGLLPVYLIHGDEPFLIQEAFEILSQAAQPQGFIEKKRLEVDGTFQWQSLVDEAATLSLFSDKSLLHLHNPEAKFDEKASQALAQYAALNPPDKLLIITSSRIASNRYNSKWYKAIDAMGAVIPIWPLNPQQLQSFLQERSLHYGLKIRAEALSLLAKMSEGNLLAANQTLIKLTLYQPEGPVDARLMAQMINDAAKFTVFDLANAVFSGAAVQASRILESLKETGTEAILVLWALQRELAPIIALKQKPGASFPSKNPQLQLQQAAAHRLNPQTLKQAVALASQIDFMIKGIEPGDPWQALLDLTLVLCDISLPHLRHTVS